MFGNSIKIDVLQFTHTAIKSKYTRRVHQKRYIRNCKEATGYEKKIM